MCVLLVPPPVVALMLCSPCTPSVPKPLPLQFEPDAKSLLLDARTGWLVLMEGIAISSIATELYTGTRDSHIGILLCFHRPDERARVAHRLDCPESQLPADGILLWEAVRGMHDSCIDFVTAQVRQSGPRLVSLSDRLAQNRDDIVVRLAPLVRSSSRAIPDIDITLLLLDFAIAYQSFSFEDNPVVLLRAAYDHGPMSRNDPRSDKVFCSDGVGRALIHCHLMSASCNTRELTPADFDSDRPDHLPLIGCELTRPPHLLAASKSGNTALEYRLKGFCSIQ